MQLIPMTTTSSIMIYSMVMGLAEAKYKSVDYFKDIIYYIGGKCLYEGKNMLAGPMQFYFNV